MSSIITLCGFMFGYQHFERTCCLQLHLLPWVCRWYVPLKCRNTRCETICCHNWDNHRINFFHCFVNLRTYTQHVEVTSSPHEGKHPFILFFFVCFCLKWTFWVLVWSPLICSGWRGWYTQLNVVYQCWAWNVFWNELYPDQ